MITIYNKSNNRIYLAELRMWNGEKERYDPDILQEIDTDLLEKWDPMIDMFVMSQYDLDDWRDFWKDEIASAERGNSELLDYAEYHFFCLMTDWIMPEEE